MKKSNILILIFIIVLTNISANAQYKNLNVKLGKYTFSTKFDSSSYLTTFKIKKGKNTIYYKTTEIPITGITEYDLNNDGNNEILIDMYSGGAHCCTYLVAAVIKENKFKILDTIYWGNSFYTIEDLNKDGRKEIFGASDIFAYAFTNFAQSEDPILIYGFENNKFKNVTKNFPDIVKKDIEAHLKKLIPYTTDTGFACPITDTFNTDAGTVKAILAPIVADYYTLGEVKRGYDLVDSVYKCPDKDKFIQTLQSEYKLK
ncbi:MAG: hypothetical protein M3R36_07365 [Bacteroidota bacterium]|nr:hypothetical protein [Bacteroidota bacterium]